MAGIAVALTLQVTAIMLLGSPAWKAITLHLIGH
jgi:hypothetical protein